MPYFNFKFFLNGILNSTSDAMDILNYMKDCQNKVNLSLKQKLPSPKKSPQHLHQAMTYSVLQGGKRLRPALIYATGEAFGAQPTTLDHVSVAIELIHSFSLIHDDLPALDNDELRRGKPTCHKVFGESTAILAGDALQALAFEVLVNHIQKNPKIHSQCGLKMIQELTHAIGSYGMAGGEELDIQFVNQKISSKTLENMYKMKTSSLLCASVKLAALAANCDDDFTLKQLHKFGEYIGLAFQIHDDIIGIDSDTKTLGKQQGNDILLNKPVYPMVVGLTEAKRKEIYYYEKALSYLDKINVDTYKLKEISSYIIQRNF